MGWSVRIGESVQFRRDFQTAGRGNSSYLRRISARSTFPIALFPGESCRKLESWWWRTNRPSAAGVSDALRLSGYEVTEAPDGAVGLREAASDGVDLVLLDIMLPKRDGLEVLAELRRTQPDPAGHPA